MSAAAERKAKLEKVRQLLAVQGEDLSLSKAFGEGGTSFRITLPPPSALRAFAEHDPELAEDFPLAFVSVEWLSMFINMLGFYAPDRLRELGEMMLAVPSGASAHDQAFKWGAELMRHRDRGAIKAQTAAEHMVIYAPEVFLTAVNLLIASGRAWVAKEIDCDEARAEEIVSEEIAKVTAEAKERIDLRARRRPPAFTKPQLRDALFSLYARELESPSERPYTQAKVVESFRTAGIPVTERTLSDYAAGSVYGSWDALVEGYVKEFDHRMALDSEEIDRLIDESDSHAH